jgi:hypothetical protein
METIKDLQKAFREARIAGEQKLSRREITWDEYAFSMVSYELQLREMGVDL